MKVAITGSSGFIGCALVDALRADGHDVVRFVRRPPAASDEATWDPAAGTVDRTAIEGAEAVVHLAGEGLGEKRWSDQQKKRILDSRVQGTTAIARAVADVTTANGGTGPVLVSGSAVGYYGLRGDEVLTEKSSAGDGFLAHVVREWEAAAAPAAEAGARLVLLRTGIVLGRSRAGAGALSRMLPLFKLGLGGKLGSGRQWWSWVSLADEIGIVRHAIASDAVEGPINATAPNPATNADVAKALGKALHRPAVLPVPAFALGIVMGRELTREVALAGQRVLPAVAERTGYSFRHPTLDEGLAAVVA
ncbi:MAG TPA: TIGR01777 family oxidoreductase [Acidimicrobiales bacterium]